MPLKLPSPRIDSRPATTPPPQLTPLLDGQVFKRPGANAQNTSAAYQQWQQSYSREDLGPLLKSLQPAIDKSLQRYVGAPDALLRGQAKTLVAQALPKYDPQRASLETFVDRQLQPMQRWQSRRRRPAKLPDRMQMEATAISRIASELEQETGRSPSTRQIADASGIPVKRIEHIRRIDRQLLQTSFEVPSDEPGGLTAGDGAVYNDAAASTAWMKFIRDDLGDIDQAILEHTTGLDGAEVLSNQALAAKLRLSPGAISQRKARIQAILDKETSLSPFG